eukprot:122193-Prymnesium_polylepis.1
MRSEVDVCTCLCTIQVLHTGSEGDSGTRVGRGFRLQMRMRARGRGSVVWGEALTVGSASPSRMKK